MTIAPPPPPEAHNRKYGDTLIAGNGISTILADIDFETYSTAGYVWSEKQGKFMPLPGTKKKGLQVVGAARYAEHPEAEVLCCAYNLKDGNGTHLWIPGDTPPYDLFDHIHKGLLIEAWNARFEYWIWNNVCVRKYGWPALDISRMRDAAAKARAFALPGSLDPAGKVLNIKNKKNEDGKRLIRKFSIPRKPTLKNPNKRIYFEDSPEDAKAMCDYNINDILAEAEISSLVPDLTDKELEFWICDQHINTRGIRLDIKLIDACIKILKEALLKYNDELRTITKGQVNAASKVQKMKTWLSTHYGIEADSLDEEAIDDILKLGVEPQVKRVLEIRGLVGSAAVKKLYSMRNTVCDDQRVHDMFIYHSARTGRAAGAGVQPQNFPNSGLKVLMCEDCSKYRPKMWVNCPFCGSVKSKDKEWNQDAAEQTIEMLLTEDLNTVEFYYDNALGAISGCLRGMFIASENHDLICSDYSSIEAVVLAQLAGEEWRLEVFRTHGRIYEMSASMITGVDFDEYVMYKSTTGEHHADRKIGKVAELASGYQGFLGAWKAFKADEFMGDDEIKEAVMAWRAASPAIVDMWKCLESCAINAVNNPGVKYSHKTVSYHMRQNVLYCTLPSGRTLTYHRPRIMMKDYYGRMKPSLSYEGWNSNPKYGAPGWIRMDSYGGKLTENVVQAVARDILAHAIINLEKAGYPVVLHVHDEIVCEIPENFGSIEEFEEIMSKMPDWARDYPIKAKGGWRRKRYGK